MVKLNINAGEEDRVNVLLKFVSIDTKTYIKQKKMNLLIKQKHYSPLNQFSTWNIM